MQLLKPIGGNYISPEDALKQIENYEKDEVPEVKIEAPEAKESPIIIPSLEGRIIDAETGDKGRRKGQEDWIEYFNKENRVMIAMPDLYLACKYGDDNLIESLKNDLKEGDSKIITSTRIIHDMNDRSAVIVHYYGSKVAAPIKSGKLFAPVYTESDYSSYGLDEFLKKKEELEFFQALFGTKDGAEEIKKTLEKLHDDSNKIFVWPATFYQVKLCPERVPYIAKSPLRASLMIENKDPAKAGYSRGVTIKK